MGAVVCVLGISVVCLTGCGDGSGGPAGNREPSLQIAVIPKGTTHEFWKAIHAGALKASLKFGRIFPDVMQQPTGICIFGGTEIAGEHGRTVRHVFQVFLKTLPVALIWVLC